MGQKEVVVGSYRGIVLQCIVHVTRHVRGACVSCVLCDIMVCGCTMRYAVCTCNTSDDWILTHTTLHYATLYLFQLSNISALVVARSHQLCLEAVPFVL